MLDVPSPAGTIGVSGGVIRQPFVSVEAEPEATCPPSSGAVCIGDGRTCPWTGVRLPFSAKLRDAPQSLQDSICRVLTLETHTRRNRRYTFGRILPKRWHVSSIFRQKYPPRAQRFSMNDHRLHGSLLAVRRRAGWHDYPVPSEKGLENVLDHCFRLPSFQFSNPDSEYFIPRELEIAVGGKHRRVTIPLGLTMGLFPTIGTVLYRIAVVGWVNCLRRSMLEINQDKLSK